MAGNSNKTKFQISVTAELDDGTEEHIASGRDSFNPNIFKNTLIECEQELAHSPLMIGEITRKLTIEIEFDSWDSLEDKVKDAHEALRDRCFKFDWVEPTVVSALVRWPAGGGFHKADVLCDFSNGKQKVVFDFFSDELTFHPSEFYGKTEKQCHELFTKKDIAYLRS
jgi:hypothetical protein